MENNILSLPLLTEVYRAITLLFLLTSRRIKISMDTMDIDEW